MSEIGFIGFPGNGRLAEDLAAGARGRFWLAETRHFPDGETYLRLPAGLEGRSIALVCSLANPDAKFLMLAFAARTARELGAKRVGLVAPYLSYMRQDRRFRDGEAVTARCFAALISETFDWLVTVDPHLHRYRALSELYSIPALALHAAPLMGEWIARNLAHPYLIGPDEESLQWVSQVAQHCGAPFCTLRKERLGDRDVRLASGNLGIPAKAVPVLIDDVISSGQTMRQAVRMVRPLTPHRPIVVGVHGLFADGADIMLEREGARLVTTNTVLHASNRIDVAALIAPAAVQMANLA